MKNKLYFLALLLLAFSGCKKDPLTQPAKVHFHFGMLPIETAKELYHGEENTNEPNTFYIDKGNMTISAIEFEGRRKDASDIFFNVDYDPVVDINLHQQTSSTSIDYDIPQGIYKRIEMIFHIGGSEILPLVLKGMANIEDEGSIQIIFEYGYDEEIKVVAKPEQGNEIILNKDTFARARAELDIDILFRLVNIERIQNADIVTIDGVKTILINKDNNKSTFNIIAARLNQSLRLVFE